jgi:predicted 3-demethylubiquinone-9 3-methyltransferase (glyoxalase superfamily)
MTVRTAPGSIVSMRIVRRADQRRIDYYWARLSADPKAEQCGWLKNRFGVSRQVVPAAMDAMVASGDRAALEKAYWER